MDKPRCQSCGMPVQPGFYGTEIGGNVNPDYCKFCYQDGKYVLNLTMQQMIDGSINFMSSKLGLSKEKAKEMSEEVIPKLKRWQ